jgi:NAD(P)-dependent dehydrogenase (short-subunit alcohol dehydrogenase family)
LADSVATQFGRLDVLINNAALVPDAREVVPGASDRAADGGTQWETQWGVNVESYYIMMNRFRPLLAKAVPAGTGRIVNVASNYAGDLDISDPQFVRRRYDSTAAYRASTQARRMISREAASQFASDGIIVNSCHPGVVTTKVLSPPSSSLFSSSLH